MCSLSLCLSSCSSCLSSFVLGKLWVAFPNMNTSLCSFFFYFGHHKNLKIGNYFKSLFDLVIQKTSKLMITLDPLLVWSSQTPKKHFVGINSSRSTSRNQHIFNKSTISFYQINNHLCQPRFIRLWDNCYILDQGPFTD
jgi:hypothetical protein